MKWVVILIIIGISVSWWGSQRAKPTAADTEQFWQQQMPQR